MSSLILQNRADVLEKVIGIQRKLCTGTSKRGPFLTILCNNDLCPSHGHSFTFKFTLGLIFRNNYEEDIMQTSVRRNYLRTVIVMPRMPKSVSSPLPRKFVAIYFSMRLCNAILRHAHMHGTTTRGDHDTGTMQTVPNIHIFFIAAFWRGRSRPCEYNIVYTSYFDNLLLRSHHGTV